MPQETKLNQHQVIQRPLFLPLLCLLTFFGSITGIVFSGLGYFKAGTVVERIATESAGSQLKTTDYSSGNLKSPITRVGNITEENYKKFSIGGIVAYLLCIVGAVLIYEGKISGFYSLVLGVFFNLITHFLLFGDNFAAMGLSMIAALLGLVIVVLFSLHLKYLQEE